MAQLKDLIVNGASRLIGDAYVNTIQITKLNAPTSAGGSTYGAGSENQVLLSNGSSIYWGKPNISSLTNDAGYITSADVPEGASAYTGTISAIGTTASAGTDNGFARGDHVHNITKATIDNILGTGSETAKFYREDGTWATPDYIANTDEKLKIAAVTSGTTYYPIVATNSTAAANRQYDSTGFAYVGTNGTTSAIGTAKITLGNSTASGTANNKQGSIVLYGSTAYATTITPGAPSAARTITLPNGSGTVALNSNPTIATDNGTATVTLAHNTTYKLTAGGGSLIFKTPVDTNTDTKVTQAYSTTNNSYPLLMSATAGVSSTGSRGDATSILNNSFYANPNTGTLSTKNLVITDTSSTARIEFSRVGTTPSSAPNYIQFPASSRLNFVGGATRGNDVSMMILESDSTTPSIFPGKKDTVNLGSSSLPWNNIYTKTVTLSQDPVNALEAATKQYVDNLKPYEIKIKSTSSTYSIVTDLGAQGVSINLNSATTAQEICANAENCIINSSDYGYVETNYATENISGWGQCTKIYGKAYYSVDYFECQHYILFEIIAAPNKDGQKIYLYARDGEDELANQALKTHHSYNVNNNSYPLLMSSITTATYSGYAQIYHNNNNIYANPSTGRVTAKSINVSGDASIAFNSKGILFEDGYARIGGNNTTKHLGLYALGNIYLRPQGTDNGDGTFSGGDHGIIISTTAITPGITNETSLGTTNKKWTAVYADLFYGKATGAEGADRLNIPDIGTEIQPVYFSNGLPTLCSEMLPVIKSNPDFSATTSTVANIRSVANLINPVTTTAEYGGILTFPQTGAGNTYNPQLLISSSGNGEAPHAYIRRLKSSGTWTNWATLLDNRGGNLTGHLYLTGITTNTTGNTSQIVFGNNSNQSVALTAIDGTKALYINPSSSSAGSGQQIRLSVEDLTLIPKGVQSTFVLKSGNYGTNAPTGTAEVGQLYFMYVN